jgi:hypothetical protein
MNYIGEDADDYEELPPPKVKKKPGPKPTMTDEEALDRRRKTALDWYNERKSDAEFMEKRRKYAAEYYARKKQNLEEIE